MSVEPTRGTGREHATWDPVSNLVDFGGHRSSGEKTRLIHPSTQVKSYLRDCYEGNKNIETFLRISTNGFDSSDLELLRDCERSESRIGSLLGGRAKRVSRMR